MQMIVTPSHVTTHQQEAACEASTGGWGLV